MNITDIFFASFLLDNGFTIKDYIQDGTFITFIFDIESDKLKELKVKYINSKHNLIKIQIEKLKGLAK